MVGLPQDCGDVQALGLSWYYDWSTNPYCSTGADFVPMVWGDWCPGATDCGVLPARLAASGAKELLAFNEPDSASQSNVSVQRALGLWPYLQSTGLRLGSPAITDDSAGHAWLDAFMSGVRQRGLRVDFIALHWYGGCTNGTQLTNYLSTMSKYGLPIWLTEFSCYNQSAATNTQYVQQVVSTLLSLPSVERIAWFTNRPHQAGYDGTGLVTDAGALTTVGTAYSALPAVRTTS
jgi:Glycosyl hydrolase catalytic core